MIKYLLVVSVFLLNVQISAAGTKNCTLVTSLLWQPSMTAILEDTPSGLALTLQGHDTDQELLFNLERQTLDVTVHGEKLVVFVGSKTVKSKKYANDVSIILDERLNAEGEWNVTLNTDIRVAGMPAGTISLQGALTCGTQRALRDRK